MLDAAAALERFVHLEVVLIVRVDGWTLHERRRRVGGTRAVLETALHHFSWPRFALQMSFNMFSATFLIRDNWDKSGLNCIIIYCLFKLKYTKLDVYFYLCIWKSRIIMRKLNITFLFVYIFFKDIFGDGNNTFSWLRNEAGKLRSFVKILRFLWI